MSRIRGNRRRTGRRTAAGGIGVYLHAFRRQWPLAITLGLVCGAAAAIAAWFLTSERYTAVALLQIVRQRKTARVSDCRTGDDQ